MADENVVEMGVAVLDVGPEVYWKRGADLHKMVERRGCLCTHKTLSK